MSLSESAISYHYLNNILGLKTVCLAFKYQNLSESWHFLPEIILNFWKIPDNKPKIIQYIIITIVTLLTHLKG